MRVALIAPPWLSVPPHGYGGTELVLDELCRGLSGQHDVLLFTTGDSTCPVERAWTFETASGTDVMQPAIELRHAIAAYDAVKIWGADVVHDHTMVGPFVALTRRDTLTVTTNHGPFDATSAQIYRALAQQVPIIAISHHQAAAGGGVPIAAVIHHGVDATRFPLGSGRGGYALFLGRMTPEKGAHTAIEVARRAGIPLRIAAKMREPAEYRYFTECIKPLLGAGIEYLGEVSGDDKASLLGDAVCLLNPIGWPEPFGMVMIEALACGTPVVTTPSGAAGEIVDHAITGFLADNEHSLASAVDRASGLDRMACRRAVEARFSASRMTEDHVALYQQVLESGSSTLGQFELAQPV